MKKFLKALTVLAAVATFSSPAAAQLNGELSVSTSAFQTFSAKAALEYNLALTSQAKLAIGAIYTTGAFGVNGTGALSTYVNLDYALNDKFNVGAELGLDISSLGVNNTVGVTLIPFAVFHAIDNGQLTLDVTGQLPMTIVQPFDLGFTLSVDGTYFVNKPFSIEFGADAGLGLVPAFGFAGAGFYATLKYQISDPFLVFAGFSGSYLTTFGYDITAGLRYDLSSVFALKLTAGYDGAFRATLQGLYNR